MTKYLIYCISILASHSLYALTTLLVTISSDNNPGGFGEVGDLRYMLNTMNQDLQTIPDDYAIVFNSPMTIQLNGLLPIINNSANPVNITIGNSNPASRVIIDGSNGTYSGFFIPTGNVTIQNMDFQNLTARGGNGGDGISGGGGGLGAGGAIYVPQTFLNGTNPSVSLLNVSINHCSAVGGNGGSYLGSSASGNEGGGGGGGFSGNGGSVIATGNSGSTGGAGGGGYGGNGGDVQLSTDNPLGGGGGGGGGLGSRATIGILNNLGNGGSDQDNGSDGNGYGLNTTAGLGGGGNTGGNRAGGGGGGGTSNPSILSGGGGGGSSGFDGIQPQGSTPLGAKHKIIAAPSGGAGGDGAGGGGGGVVSLGVSNAIDGQAGNGGYGGGGGGGAGAGAFDTGYMVQAGSGGSGGGGGGGGVNRSGMTSAAGGNSLAGGGGGGGGPSNGSIAPGGVDSGNLGGGTGGNGANDIGSQYGGGGGGGGSGLGGAVFIDSGLNFTIQALAGIPTSFNTPNNTTQAGTHGVGNSNAADGTDGSALGNSIFLRTNSSLTFTAQNVGDVLTLGDQVAFTDDTSFGAGGTSVFVTGNGSVIYQGTTDYEGSVTVNNANFKVNGQIDHAPVFVCRNINFSQQRGTLSGHGIITGSVFANSGTISPESGETLTLGALALNSATNNSLGSLVHIDISSSGTSLVAVNGNATLAGTLEINLDPNTSPGQYTLLTSGSISGTFDSVTFTGPTPNYTITYLPNSVRLNFSGFPSTVNIPATVNGSPILNPAVVCCGRPVLLGPLPVPGSGPTVYTIINKTGNVTCQIGQTNSQIYLKMRGTNGSCTIIGKKNNIVSSPLKVIAP